MPLTVWTFLTQALSPQKSCVAAVARVLTLLAILGRDPCHSGSGAYCKARAKLSESFLRRLAVVAHYFPDCRYRNVIPG